MIEQSFGKLTEQFYLTTSWKNAGRKKFDGASQWSLNDWISILAKGGGAKKRFQCCLNPNSSSHFLYFRASQGHSGDNAIDPEVQDNVALPEGFTEYIYHVGNASEMNSIIRSGLIEVQVPSLFQDNTVSWVSNVNGVDQYVTESMPTAKEEDIASGKAIAKARPRQKPTVTCYKFDNADLGFGPGDRSAHLPVFLHLRSTNIPGPSSVMRSPQAQHRRQERPAGKQERKKRRKQSSRHVEP